MAVTHIESPFHVWVIDWDLPFDYDVLNGTFPTERFLPMKVGSKFSLGQKSNPEAFRDFLKKNKPWRDFYDFTVEKLGRYVEQKTGVKVPVVTRFEFSRLPAYGGHVNPHPDIKKKVVTAIFFFPGEWDSSWGGGFEMLKYNGRVEKDLSNIKIPWEKVETVRVIDFEPRKIVIMRRRIDSFHCVRPIRGPEGVFRNSVTINFMARAGSQWNPSVVEPKTAQL